MDRIGRIKNDNRIYLNFLILSILSIPVNFFRR